LSIEAHDAFPVTVQFKVDEPLRCTFDGLAQSEHDGRSGVSETVIVTWH
jgi:hypothetical protein